ncbi:hypothetical protein [Psychroflexus tropicus]|uniref:hypothetical protein n=1 Tax=Psychroflexus tropicus TaxID=197345 RepID=UPI00036A2420|nr:hypothetical protein [Psychroflexus tropicus]
MMRRLFPILFIAFIGSHFSFSQEAQSEKSLYNAFAKGELHGEVRNFFMNTINEGKLKDYYTNATGIAFNYETKPLYGFFAGVHFRSVFKTFGVSLSQEDPLVGAAAKWEYELYDLLEKGNYKDLNKVQELYLKYQYKNSYFSIGRIETEYTPLLNNSDGRMGPFAHQGVWWHHRWNDNSTLDFGFINAISPRSTTDWFSLNEGIGLFSNGFLPNGEIADYRNYTNSEGLGVIKYLYSKANLNFILYDIFVHNLLNTVWLETDYSLNNWRLGLQYALQHGAGAQKDLPLQNQYTRDGENGQVLSTELTWSTYNWTFSFAYSHLFDTGRFLFPKELGRDRFYTSIPRSRMEGLGNANAAVLKIGKSYPQSNLDVLFEFQTIQGLELEEFTFNKYNKDESFQVNSIINYSADQFLRGLSFEALLVYRRNLNDTSNPVIFNRSNFLQLNFMTYFRF